MCTYWNLIFFIKIVWTWSHWTLFLHGPVCCTKEDLSSEMYEVLKENNLNIGPLTASFNRNSNFRNCTGSRNTQLRSIHFRGQTNYTIPYCSYNCFTFKRPKKTEHLRITISFTKIKRRENSFSPWWVKQNKKDWPSVFT